MKALVIGGPLDGRMTDETRPSFQHANEQLSLRYPGSEVAVSAEMLTVTTYVSHNVHFGEDKYLRIYIGEDVHPFAALHKVLAHYNATVGKGRTYAR